MQLPPSQPHLSAEVAARAAVAADIAERRASLQFRVAQTVKSSSVIMVALVCLVFALFERVPRENLFWWAGLMIAATLVRGAQSIVFASRATPKSDATLRRQEQLILTTSNVLALVMGSAFWFLALPGDFYVRMLITLLSMLFMIGSIVNATSDDWRRYVRGGGNIGQGILFWLGLGTGGEPQWAVLAAYGGLIYLAFTFVRERRRQLHDSMAIRGENAALLLQLQADKETIENALRQAKLANESKNQFLAAASHDLRQPLHALTMFLGTLSFHVSTDEAKRLLGRIKDTAGVLEEQFNSLLDLSRFDAGVVVANIKPFRLDDLVLRLVDEMRPMADAKDLTLCAAAGPAHVNSDPLLVGRLLRNLLDNAIKYTSSGSIHIAVIERTASFSIEVTDTGPGIPLDQQTRIFNEYVQLANPGRQRSHGVGLGLAIVKRIEQLLGLKLELHSVVGSGSRFVVDFPAARGDSGVDLDTADAIGRATDFSTSASVWLLDDDPIALESLQGQMKAWGASVSVFRNPDELLSKLRTGDSPPQWIFTDDMLGASMSGLDLAQAAAGEFHIENVCLITGNTEPKRLAQLKSSGFPIIVKPAKSEQLITLLRN